jgi:hypothetical protein
MMSFLKVNAGRVAGPAVPIAGHPQENGLDDHDPGL